MLLLSESTRKTSAILSSVWMLTLTLMPTVDALATDSAFTAGQAMGTAASQSAVQNITNQTSLQNLGITGIGTQSAPSSLTNLYKGGGKNGLDSITNLNQVGMSTMSNNQQCLPGSPTYANCMAIKSGGQKLQNQLNGQDPRAKYMNTAQALRSAQLKNDPLAVLGLGIPNPGGGSICTNTTANLPSYTQDVSCLQAEFHTVYSLPRLPVTTNYIYTSPYCIDPTMTLNSSQTLCEKTTYSCPNGGTLNGTSCVMTTNPLPVTYSGCATAQSGGSWTQYIANGQDWWNVQAMCAPDGVNIQVYANAAGGWGNCGQPGSGYWNVMPITSYSGKVTHISTPSWNGSCQAYATRISGGCSNGTCTYQVSFDYANYLGTQCYNSDSFQQTCDQSWMHWYSGYASDITTAINTNNVQSGFSPVATLTFPQNATNACPSGYNLQNGSCVYTYPATANYSSASPGCLGAPIPAGNNSPSAGTQYVSGNQTGGTMTCQTKYYSCPATMNMNGMMCEDPTRPNYLNPNCTNLGTDPNVQKEVFLCVNNKLDECAALDLTKCTSKNTDSCVDTDQITGSPTFGKCLATQKNYSCPVPQQTITTTKCGYDPMCFNGNCFTPPGSKCSSQTVNNTSSTPESCLVQRPQEYRQCSLVETTSGSTVTGYTPGADCSTISSAPMTSGGGAASCTQIPPTFDSATGHYPTKLNYSCVGPAVNTCGTLASRSECSVGTSTCSEYQCLDPLPLTISNTQQAGTNTTSTGAMGVNAPAPTADLNTCTNKGVCVLENKTYNCTSTTSMVGDECTTDLGQVLVSMEAARQAGTYVNPQSIKIFSGEFDRCDRRAFSVFGAGLGSKSCCNIQAPDAKSNADVLGNAVISNALSNGGALVSSGVTKASGYMFDYMMNSANFSSAAMSAWSSGLVSDETTMAASGASVGAFSPSLNFMGVSASFGPLGGGVSGMVTNFLDMPAIDMLSPASLGTMTTPFGTMTFSVDPVSLGFQVGMAIYQAYQAALACDEEDYKSTTKKNANLCYDTGTWCESKDCGFFGCTCTKFRTGRCCYNSKLARIINQQGRSQLGLDMRACDGFTVAQIQALDWSRIDLTEFIADMLAQAQVSTNSVLSNGVPALQNKVKTTTTQNATTQTQPNTGFKQ